MKRHWFVLLLGALALPALVLAADARIGTWKFNPAKSKFDPGPGYMSRTVKVEAAGEGIKVSVDGHTSDGKPEVYTYTANYDGKDYPVSGNPAADTIAYKKIDDYNTEATTKKGGQVAAHITIVVARDGKSMILTATGKNDKGPFTNVSVYDRQ